MFWRLPIPSRTTYKIDFLCHTALTTAYPKYVRAVECVYTSKTTALIIESKYPQHCRSKNKVIWTASICLPNIWNKVPGSIRTVEEKDTFKRHLKTALFQQNA